MRIVIAEPPLIDRIDEAFKVRGKPVIFAWGDKIYNPMGINVGPELVAHEKVHGERQIAQFGDDDVEGWWDRYIEDPQFRLAEEIPAHVAEYAFLCGTNAHRWNSQRNMRRTYAAAIARKLSSPLYGNLISFEVAKKMFLKASTPP